MNSAEIKGAYHAIVSSPDRGQCLVNALSNLTQAQRIDLFDTLIAGDQAELGRFMEALLIPVIERHIAAELQRKIIFDRKGDNEV